MNKMIERYNAKATRPKKKRKRDDDEVDDIDETEIEEEETRSDEDDTVEKEDVGNEEEEANEDLDVVIIDDDDEEGEDDMTDVLDVLCSKEDIEMMIEVEKKFRGNKIYGTQLNSTDRKKITISSSRLFYIFNIINLAWQQLAPNIDMTDLNELDQYLILMLGHVTKFVEPFNQLNSGDGRPLLLNLTFYSQCFYRFSSPGVAKATSITLHRMFQWKENEDIMKAYLSQSKFFNELHIERFHSVLQRLLPSNTQPTFQVIKDAAERASVMNIARNQVLDAVKVQKRKSSQNYEETLVYSEQSKKTPELTETVRRVLLAALRQTNEVACDGLSTKNIDPASVKVSVGFVQKTCKLDPAEGIEEKKTGET